MKKTKSLWRVSVVTTPEAEDAVTELLGAVSGQPVSSYFDIEAGVTTITAYCPQKPPSPVWMARPNPCRSGPNQGLRAENRLRQSHR